MHEHTQYTLTHNQTHGFWNAIGCQLSNILILAGDSAADVDKAASLSIIMRMSASHVSYVSNFNCIFCFSFMVNLITSDHIASPSEFLKNMRKSYYRQAVTVPWMDEWDLQADNWALKSDSPVGTPIGVSLRLIWLTWIYGNIYIYI